LACSATFFQRGRFFPAQVCDQPILNGSAWETIPGDRERTNEYRPAITDWSVHRHHREQIYLPSLLAQSFIALVGYLIFGGLRLWRANPIGQPPYEI